MKKTKHLLVDGWNVIHSNARMKAAMEREGQESAKRLLSDALSPLHDSLGMRLTIVYDGRGEDISLERIGRQLTFSEIYTPSSMTADELIEQMCATSKDPDSLIVASKDSLIQLTARGFAVETISPDRLLEWAASTNKSLSEDTRQISFKSKMEWKKSTNPFNKIKDE